MKAAPISLDVPYDSDVVDNKRVVTRPWSTFFRAIQSALFPLGTESAADIANNQVAAALIEGLSFDLRKVGMGAVDYYIQRVTTGGGAVELIESGTFYASYKPTSANWVLSNVPSTAGVTLSIDAGGAVSYTSSNVTGTALISKITFRARTLAAKNYYSVMGAG